MADTHLLVRVPFGDFAVGDVISDPDQVEAFADRTAFVVRVPAVAVEETDR